MIHLEKYALKMKRVHNDTNGVMLYVRYRLAPENKFPVPVEDCVELTKWVFVHSEQLGIDRNKIQITGDSAGGNLVLNVAIELMKEVQLRPNF